MGGVGIPAFSRRDNSAIVSCGFATIRLAGVFEFGYLTFPIILVVTSVFTFVDFSKMAEVNENAGAVVKFWETRYGHSKIVGRVCRSLRPIRLDTDSFMCHDPLCSTSCV